MKAQESIHATKGQEQAAECTDRLSSHGKRMSSRQAMDTHGSGVHTQDLGTTNLYPANTRSGGPWIKGKRGYGLAVGRKGEPILGFLLKFFWEKCLTGMTYHLKEGKMSWNH